MMTAQVTVRYLFRFAACAALLAILDEPVAQGAAKLTYLGPEHVGVGQVSDLTVVTSGGVAVEGIEITPSDGVTVGEIKRGVETTGEKGRGWTRWVVPITVASSATLGKRQVVVLTPAGQAGSEKIEIVSHVPVISDLVVTNAKSIGAIVEFQFIATDRENDLGDRPKVVYAEGEESRSGYLVSAKIIAFDAEEDLRHFRVQARVGGHNFLTIGFAGTRPMTVFIQDKKGNKSNKLQGEYTW